MENKEQNKIIHKLEHIWSIVCSLSVTDEDSKNMSLFNLIETLNIEIEPNEEQKKERDKNGWYSLPLNLQLVTRFRKKLPGEEFSFVMQVTVLDPRKNVLGKESENTLVFGRSLSNVRVRTILGNFPLNTKGLYHVIVKVKDVSDKEFIEIARVPIDVNLTVKK